MPVVRNPGNLRVGGGPEEVDRNLTGAGITGAPPNIGTLGDSLVAVPDTDHTHTAREVFAEVFESMEDATEAFHGAMAAEPPKLGETKSFTTLSGIPDWGVLKLNDSDLVTRGLLFSSVQPSDIYPYYWVAPSPAIDGPFVRTGADPQTDTTFNSGLTELDIPGAGPGKAYAGAFTRPGTAGGAPQPTMRTARIMGRTGVVRQEVTISGSVYPADRGVLALVHWPADGDIAAYIAQSLTDRCIAALLLGQGLTNASGGYVGDDCATLAGDGDPGGIFAVGSTNNNYDPFAFPGRATGQYNLNEIHLGVAASDGSVLRAPFDDLDGDTVAGSKRIHPGVLPGAGQVRLGTDLSAGAVVDYGIPILGGTGGAYNPLPGTTINGNSCLYNSILLNSNFYGYRLPVLNDYSLATGLKHTPSGTDRLTTKETVRYFSVVNPATVGDFTQAGNYDNFSQDCFHWQIARFRHTFAMPSTAGAGVRQENGSYWFIHFKKEANFEAFVRDGVMPWDATNGYDVYGVSMVDTADVESLSNVVNTETSTAVFAPLGPAPTYGYQASTYPALTSTIMQDPYGLDLDPADWGTLDYFYTSDSAPGAETNVMQVSGVWYFTPRRTDTGAPGFVVTDIEASGNDFWLGTYRTDDSQLTAGVAPAKLSSPNPSFVGVAPFAYGVTGGVPHFTVTTGIPGAAITDANGPRPQRIEIPYNYMGSSGGNPFSETNGPRVAGTAVIDTFAGSMELLGDTTTPAFSTNAKMRLFFRRPIGHNATTTSALPYDAALGHGLTLAPNSDPTTKIMFHSTRFDTTNQIGSYGNFITGAAPAVAYTQLAVSEKYYTEKFLDEVFRWNHKFPAGLPDLTERALLGPGLASWIAVGGGPVEIPVSIGTNATWVSGSWVQNDYHKLSLIGAVPASTGLQVAGFPDRNPPLSDGVNAAFPSSGVLLYPQEDYSGVSIRPQGGIDMTAAQPNYTGLTGERVYSRAFDVGMQGGQPEMDGATKFKIRFDGLQLADYAYVAPGPGTLSTRGIAILVKVPGLTTWMDVGRLDGSGPSKQDAVLDGAGCQVIGTGTFNSVDANSGIVYSQVEVHVGPNAALFTTAANEIPVLVKVVMDENAVDYNLKKEWNGVAFIGGATVGLSSSVIRGLTGIRIVPQVVVT